MRNLIPPAMCFILGAGLVLAQNVAPRETVTTSINGKSVSVEYGRPSLKGRSFEDLLKKLPPDRFWRTGSEQFTSLSTEADVLIGDKKVPAGKYSLYVHCAEDGSYSLAVNSVLGQPLSKIFPAAPPRLANEPWPHFNYTKEIGDKEVARASMKKGAGSGVDMFTIAFEPAANGSVMRLSWGDVTWTVDVKPAN